VIKKISLSVLLVLLLSACGSESASKPQSETLPVVVVDDAHFKDPNAFYDIPAGGGFILDVTHYKFTIPAGMGPVIPNYVEVANGGEVFGMDWQESSAPDEITVSQLRSLRGNTRLERFNSGEQLVVAIGNKNSGHFTAFWSATVNVK
jgi:hypothetical protein